MHRFAESAVGVQEGREEPGRVAKTLCLLNDLDDGAYRRRTLTQPNQGEGRHGVGGLPRPAGRAGATLRYRGGQKDQPVAPGLVVYAVVLWNTRDLDAALAQVRAASVSVKPEDVERPSPLRLDHVNVPGRCEFTLEESVRKG